jgi:hypothetical protein
LVATWSRLCAVSPEPVAIWLSEQSWPSLGLPVGLPSELLVPIFDCVLSCFNHALVDNPMLSLLKPGQCFEEMHVDDPLRDDWITRIHVPITTNPDAWHLFEHDSHRVHFACGYAYCFNMRAPHAFGNSGITNRVHLLFDLVSRNNTTQIGYAWSE